jgi:pimeloyl-ACP methyl ester carboxylesterase
MAESGFVDVDGGRLWYEVGGDGPAVVLVHAGLWDSRAWDAQYEAFSERYRVLRYDVRGYGRSSRPEPGVPYSHVRDLAAVLDGAGIGRAALVGNSLGGGIVLDFALTHPARTAALVLVASALGGMEDTPEDEAWWEARWPPLRDAVEAGDLERARRLQMEFWAPVGIDDEIGRRIFEISLDNAHELTMDESGAEQLDPPAIARLAEISAPTLILPADRDPPFMARANAILATEIPTARAVHLPNVDHVIAMRAPEAFNEAVLAFLDEVVGTR